MFEARVCRGDLEKWIPFGWAKQRIQKVCLSRGSRGRGRVEKGIVLRKVALSTKRWTIRLQSDGVVDQKSSVGGGGEVKVGRGGMFSGIITWKDDLNWTEPKPPRQLKGMIIKNMLKTRI